MCICFYDSANIALASAYSLYIDKNMHNYLIINWVLSIIGGIIFVLMVPESPKYQLMKDPTSTKAIKSLNYISNFNGKKYRIPSDANLDSSK